MEYCRHRRRSHSRLWHASSGLPLMLRASFLVLAFLLLSCSRSDGARILDVFYTGEHRLAERTEEFGVADASHTDQLEVPPLHRDRDEYEEEVPRGGHSLLRGVSLKEENDQGDIRRLPPSPPVPHDVNPCPAPPPPDVRGYVFSSPPPPPGKDKDKDKDKDKKMEKEDKEDKRKGTKGGNNSVLPPAPSPACTTIPDT